MCMDANGSLPPWPWGCLATCPGCHPAFALRHLAVVPQIPGNGRMKRKLLKMDVWTFQMPSIQYVVCPKGKKNRDRQCADCPGPAGSAGAATMLDVLHPAEIPKMYWKTVAGSDGKTKTSSTLLLGFICVLIILTLGGEKLLIFKRSKLNLDGVNILGSEGGEVGPQSHISQGASEQVPLFRPHGPIDQ